MDLIVLGKLMPKTIKPSKDNSSRWMQGDIRLAHESLHVLSDVNQHRLTFTFNMSSSLPRHDVIILGNVSEYRFPDSGKIWKTLDIDHIIDNDSPIFELLGVTTREAHALIGERDKAFLASLGGARLKIKQQIIDILGSKNKFADKLLEAFGDRAYVELTNNPWDKIFVIPYYTITHADKVAQHLGLSKDDPRRFRALFRQILEKEFAKHGNTYMSESEFQAIYWQHFAQTLTLEEYNDILNEDDPPVIQTDLGYHPAYLYHAEVRTYDYLEHNTGIYNGDPTPDEVIDAVLDSSDITLTGEQGHALRHALDEHLHVVTGGPGTGKTTILKAILDKIRVRHLYSSKNALKTPFLLVAPTGKAASRMQEQTGYPARTIHSAFGIVPGYGAADPEETANDLSHVEYILIDEASMLNTTLFGDMIKVIEHMYHNPKILLLGDIDQLPPVQNGQVFQDILSFLELRYPESVTRLTVVKRQGADSNIPELASYIREGRFPAPEWFKGKEDIIPIAATFNNIHEVLADTVIAGHIDQLEAMQFLTPYRNGPNPDTIHAINKVASPIYNPPKENEQVVGHGDASVSLRVGDRVVNRTNLSKDIVNGSLGEITSINSSSADLFDWTISVRFDNEKTYTYEYENWSSIEPAYAITIHSSQGSEYDIVVIPIIRQGHPSFLTRNLLYTAITRASKKVILVGPYQYFAGISQNEQTPRKTALSAWLTKGEAS